METETWVLEYSAKQAAYHLSTKERSTKRGPGPGAYQVILEGTYEQVVAILTHICERGMG